ncbi:MAG: hypothetical protein OXC26_17600 [Albidovulum sp.]|nr:hypothetical protein [Albidovulum sp.]
MPPGASRNGEGHAEKTVARKLAKAQAEVARLQREQGKEAAAGLLEERAEIDCRIAGHDSVIARGRKARAGEMRRRRNVDERIKTARKNGLIPPESETGVPPAPVEKPERNAPPAPPPDWTAFTASGEAAAKAEVTLRADGSIGLATPERDRNLLDALADLPREYDAAAKRWLYRPDDGGAGDLAIAIHGKLLELFAADAVRVRRAG